MSSLLRVVADVFNSAFVVIWQISWTWLVLDDITHMSGSGWSDGSSRATHFSSPSRPVWTFSHGSLAFGSQKLQARTKPTLHFLLIFFLLSVLYCSLADSYCYDSFRWTVKGLRHAHTCIHSPPNAPPIQATA